MNKYFPDKTVFTDAGIKNGSRSFELLESFSYISSKKKIVVPKGFITDGASIPKVFWNIFSPFGTYFPAAIIHDFLYSKASDESFKFTRQECDLIFKEAMWNIGIGWVTRETIYIAVKMFGGLHFKGE